MAWARGMAAAALLAFVADQASKALALQLLPPWPAVVPVLPVFNLVLIFNPGVTFGMLSGAALIQAGPWLLVIASLAVCGVLAWLARQAATAVERWALGAAIGGALGNALDRLRQGAVTDFLDFYYGAWHWPAFNLADVAVVCGILTYVAAGLRQPRRIARKPPPATP